MPRAMVQRFLPEFKLPIWSQQLQIGEGDALFTMFLAFANLKPTERNISTAWASWTKDTPHSPRQPSAIFKQAAVTMLWEERAAARDITELQDRYKKWGDRDWEWRESDYQVGSALRDKAKQALEQLEKDLHLDIVTIAGLFETASKMQKGAIPSMGSLTTTDIRDILAAIPETKRAVVIQIIQGEQAKRGIVEDVIDAEYVPVESVQLLPDKSELTDESTRFPKRRRFPLRNPPKATAGPPRNRPTKEQLAVERAEREANMTPEQKTKLARQREAIKVATAARNKKRGIIVDEGQPPVIPVESIDIKDL